MVLPWITMVSTERLQGWDLVQIHRQIMTQIPLNLLLLILCNWTIMPPRPITINKRTAREEMFFSSGGITRGQGGQGQRIVWWQMNRRSRRGKWSRSTEEWSLLGQNRWQIIWPQEFHPLPARLLTVEERIWDHVPSSTGLDLEDEVLFFLSYLFFVWGDFFFFYPSLIN